MSRNFDSELEKIATAHVAAIAAAHKNVADIQTARATFTSEWEACRIGLVRPALNEIVKKLEARQMAASAEEAAGVPLGASLTVFMPGRPQNLRGHAQPQLLITPLVSANHVVFKNSTRGSEQKEYKVEEITKELIEEHALELVGQVYK